uniref:Uncharacterized protein n=1 Tax=Avena sativa TaxID=4498 RepID=A0ACD5VC46_AVESA
MATTVTGESPELPEEILIDIFARLQIPDRIRAGSVRPSWRSAYTSLLSLGNYHKQSQTPCLFYTREDAGESVACVYSLVEKRVYKLTLADPLLRNKFMIGSSSQGFLVTVDERSEMQLLNPITGEQIDLPSVTTMDQVKPVYDSSSGALHMYEYSPHTAKEVLCLPQTVALHQLREVFQHKAFVLSDDTSANKSLLIVALIHNPHRQLSVARIGDDRWTWLPPHAFFDDCVFKDGLLYAVNTDGEIHAFDLLAGPDNKVTTCKMILGRSEVVKCSSMYIVQAPWGDLLQVWRSFSDYDLEPEPGSHEYWNTDRIRIYKVVDGAGKKGREKVRCLGDHVLFLGHNQSLCLSAKECPGLKANHAYFTDDSFLWKKGFENNSRDIGILNLCNNTREEIVSPQLWSDSPAPMWITLDPRKMNLVLNQV